MASNEQWIALGKLLGAYSLLCDQVCGALYTLAEGDPARGSTPVLAAYVRSPDQARAALQLLEERSQKSDFSAKTFRDLRDALNKAIDLATNDFRLPARMEFNYALYLEKEPEDAAAKRVKFWSCLTTELEAENIEILAVECYGAAIALLFAVCDLRSDEERSSSAEKPDPKLLEPDHPCKPADVPADASA